MYYAHSTDDETRSSWQRLSDHLLATADLAGLFGQRLRVAKAARLAGLLHDLGKYSPKFLARLGGSTERVDHSTAGAALVMQLAHGDDKLIAELLTYAIAGHHAGLPDKQGAAFSTLHQRLADYSDASLDSVWRQEITPDAKDLVPGFNWRTDDKARFAFQLAFLGRMIFSCLVDADFKDTEQFYASVEGREVDRDWPSLHSLLPELIERFDRHMAGLQDQGPTVSTVNELRSSILTHVRSHPSDPTGLFTLTVPTGGGKTLASLGFALNHAKAHGLDRIIYAIPFTTIIDQTAAIFRDVLGDHVVLEHHSAIEDEESESRNPPAGKEKLQLAMEDWAAPVVVTTNVQLFESLFAARSSRCRKLHNVARSVIVLDEAQTLPYPLLAPCAQALDELARNYGCTIVLCTATQPALDLSHLAAGHPAALPLAGRELAPDPAKLSETLERVRLVHAGDRDDAALVAAIAEAEQALVIVNSRKHALALYRTATQASLDGVIHLTTRQCALHRREILEEVRQRLRDKEPCRLIATSLVECGVDLDFPRVWRAEAGLDRIAQAAGRCNREGQRPIAASLVTVFNAPDYPPPAEIKGLSGDMKRVMSKHPNLLSLAAMRDFFGEVYWRLGRDGLDRQDILSDFRIGSRETNFSYRSVAEKFRMIEGGMSPVVIPRDEKSRRAIESLRIDKIPSGAIARELQPYVVQVPPKARARLIACGHVAFADPKMRRDQFAVLLTESLYRQDIGLLWEDADYLGLEQFVI